MGIYIKGAFGAFSGKVGNLVGANWRSINYMRSLPKRSSKPASEKQLAHRAKFGLAVKFLSPLRDLINLGYSDKSRATMTAFNKATDELLGHIEGTYPNFSVPYEKVQFSTGRVGNIVPTVDAGAGSVQLSWLNVRSLGSQDDDQVVMVFYNEELDDFFVIQDAIRATERYEVEPGLLPAGNYHFWTLMTNEKGQCSKTRYEGTFTI